MAKPVPPHLRPGVVFLKLVRALAFLAISFVLLTWVPSAAADCAPQEVVYLGTSPNPTSVSYVQCIGSTDWSYETPGADPPPESCQAVPVVRVLGQQVPGTGQTYCPPGVSGQSGAGQDPMPIVAVCYEAAGTTGCLGLAAWMASPGCAVGSTMGPLAREVGGSGSCSCSPLCYYLP